MTMTTIALADLHVRRVIIVVGFLLSLLQLWHNSGTFYSLRFCPKLFLDMTYQFVNSNQTRGEVSSGRSEVKSGKLCSVANSAIYVHFKIGQTNFKYICF